MALHGALQTAQRAQDAGALQSALAKAERHSGALPALDEEVAAAHAALESLSVSPPAAAAAAPPPPPPERVTAVELALDELAAATDGFADGRKIGSGGFAEVYAAEEMSSLRAERLRPAAQRRASSSR